MLVISCRLMNAVAASRKLDTVQLAPRGNQSLELLRILPSVGDTALLEGADHLGQHVALLALVRRQSRPSRPQNRLSGEVGIPHEPAT
jgi:hypothetical protein